MGLKNAAKKTFSLGLNPLRWIGLEQHKENGRVLKNIVDHYFDSGSHPSRIKSVNVESFEACMQRYHLSEKDLQKKIKFSKIFVLACLGLSVLMLIYAVYLFSSYIILGGGIALILTFLLWAYAFREHFNYFQMKQRRLGCTFKEWLIFLLRGSKK